MSSNNLDLLKLLKLLLNQPPYNVDQDKKWKKSFFKFAPYTSLSLCVIMALLGLIRHDLPLSNFEWHLSIMAALVVLLLLFVARKVKKKQRNPTIPYTLAHVVPMWGLIIIGVFFMLKINFVENSKIDGRPISDIVQEKITEKKSFLKTKSKEKFNQNKT